MQAGSRAAAGAHVTTRFQAGDPLRAIAALSVVVFHLATFAPLRVDPPVALGSAYGGAGKLWLSLNVGVSIFFVLSGYLLGRPFLRALLSGSELPAVRPYLVNRLLRIVPAFWVAAVLTILVLGTGGSSASQVAAVFGFAQAYHPSPFAAHIVQAWTLSVEMAFYFLLPAGAFVLARALRDRTRPGTRAAVIVGAILAVASGSILLRLAGSHVPVVQWRLGPAIFAFAPGLLLAIVELRAGERIGAWSRRRPLPHALVAAGLAVFAATALAEPSQPVRGLTYAVSAAFVVAAALVVEWSGAKPWRALDNRALHWIGERSYSIYLLHVLVISEVAARVGAGSTPGGEMLRLTLVSVPLILVASALSFRFVERPFLALRRSWRRRGAAAAAEGEPALAPATA